MLTAAYCRGHDEALARFGVKVARSTTILPPGPSMHPAVAQMHADVHAARATPPPIPHAAPQGASWDAAHRGVMQQLAAGVGSPSPELPPARAFEGHGAAAPPASPPAPAPAPTAPAAPAAPASGARNFMRPLGRGLGWGALGLAGAAAYGMHRQNQEDREKRNLIYAPMSGSFM